MDGQQERQELRSLDANHQLITVKRQTFTVWDLKLVLWRTLEQFPSTLNPKSVLNTLVEGLRKFLEGTDA